MFRMNSIIMGLVSLFVFGTAQAAVLTVSDYTENEDGTGTVFINMSSDEAVAGFQFNVDSSFDGFEITGASGGAATDNGFMMSTGTNMALGFSLTGGTIPAMDDILCELAVTGVAGEGFIGLSGITVSDAAGQAIESSAGDDYVIENNYEECLEDCVDFDLVDGDNDITADEACTIIVGWENDSCLDDCDPNFVELGLFMDTCLDCLSSDVYDCTTSFDCLQETNGGALDDCGVCSGGDTGHEANSDMDCAGTCFGDAVVDCNDECGGSAVVDECGECGGDGSACAPATLSFGTYTDTSYNGIYDEGEDFVDDNENGYYDDGEDFVDSSNGDNSGSLEVLFSSPADIAGFQFGVTGADGASLNATGGEATANGFMMSTGNGLVIGFSLTGEAIPAGDGVLVDLAFTATSPTVCLDGVIVSDGAGNAVDVEVGGCANVSFTLLGCTDMDACNYNADATEDNGSCWSAAEGCTCDDGEGSAVDECGVCNGGGIADGACDCDGNVNDCNDECGGSAVEDCAGECGGSAVEDCAGECGGSAMEDECGECNGDGPDACWDGSAECDVADCPDFYNTLSIGAISFNGPNGMWDEGEEFVDIGNGVYDDGEEFTDADANGIWDEGEEFVDAGNGMYDDGEEFTDTAADGSGSLEINLVNPEDVAGFQFDVNGADLDPAGATGGSAEANGFMISANETTVIGFSITGDTIPAGDGLLTNLAFTSFSGEDICISNAILASSSGDAVDTVTGECFSGFGCTDMAACNYDASAVVDDGSCWSNIDGCSCDDGPNQFLDCFGICNGEAVTDGNGDCCEVWDLDCAGTCGGTAVEDCFGECGGSATEDACGNCGGDCADDGTGFVSCDDSENNIVDADCSGVCGGDAVVDCNDECGGTAEEDACGVCEGDGSSCMTMLTIGTVDEGAGTMEIILNNQDDLVAGFQFDVTGVNITGVGGGSAEENGFLVSNSSSTVIGFSLTGATVPYGNAVLTVLEFEAAGQSACIDLDSVVLSDENGLPVTAESTGDCAELDYDATVDVDILSPADGSYLYGDGESSSTVTVDMSLSNAAADAPGQGTDHYHVYLDGNMTMVYEDTYDLVDVPYGMHTLTVVAADANHYEYENDAATETITFTNIAASDVVANAYISNVSDGFLSDDSMIEVDLMNTVPISGFSFYVSDPYDAFTITGVSGGAADAGFDLSFDDETGYIFGTGFGNLIGLGDGQALVTISIDKNIEEDGTPAYGTVNLTDGLFQDPAGSSFTDIGGSVGMGGDVNYGDWPEVPMTPAGFMAELYDNVNVSLSWEAAMDAVESYTLSRNGSVVATLPFDAVSYEDTGLAELTAYQYSLVASNISGSSDAATANVETSYMPFDTEAPTDLVATGNDGSVDLAWVGPEPAEVCDDCELDFTNYGSECCDSAWDEFGISCADLEANYNWDCSGCNCPGDGEPECGDGSCNGDETYYTCPEDCLPPGECPDGQVVDCDGSGECWPESWIGDGFADCNDQQYGADLTCYDCDGGDCPDTDPGCSGRAEEGGTSEHEIKQLKESSQVRDGSRDEVTGFNVYRATSDSDLTLIATTSSNQQDFTDSDVMNGTEYTYAVTTQYDDGACGDDCESDFSNFAEATPMSTVTLSVSDGSVMGGEEVTLTLSMSNSEEVAGFELYLVDTPDYLSYSDYAAGTDLPDGWSVTVASMDDGSTKVLGFAMPNTGNIMSGDNDVLDITFTAAASEPTTIDVCTSGEVVANSYGSPFNVNSGCGSVDLDVDGIDVMLTTDGGPVDQGGQVDVHVSIDNPFPVTGVQIVLEDTPESLAAVSVTPTPELEDIGGMVEWSEVNGNAVILWFDLSGNVLTEGFGDLFTVTYEVAADAADGPVTVGLSDAADGTAFSDSQGQSLYWGGGTTTVNVGLPDVGLSLVQTSNTSFELHMDNAGDVAGFQFSLIDNPDYYTFVDMVPTSRVPNDWSLNGGESSDGSAFILAFSLAGTTIEAGSGAIATVNVEPVNMEFESEISFADYIVSDPYAAEYYTATSSATFVNPFETGPALDLTATGGANKISLEWSMLGRGVRSDVSVEFGEGDADAGTLDVIMTNSDPVAGIQLELSGLAVSGASGGAAEEAGWMISAGGGTVLGFSVQGTTVPAGSGVLFTLQFDAGSYDGGDVCMDSFLASDPNGEAYNVQTGDCWPPAVPDVSLAPTGYSDGMLEISMANVVDVAGVQFVVESTFDDLVINSVGDGGSGMDAGWMFSTNENGLVLGFSTSGVSIPAGDGPLCYIDVSHSGEDGAFSIGSATVSDPNGQPLEAEFGTTLVVPVDDGSGCTDPNADNFNPDAVFDDGSCEYWGCTDPAADNYDSSANTDDGSCEYTVYSYTIYRDGEFLAQTDDMSFDDFPLGSNETHCYVVMDNASGGSSNEACATTLDTGLSYFTDLPEPTGEYHLVLVQDASGLNVGDEIGLFDSNAILNSDCDNPVTGELLVGAGVWNGESLEISAVGSVDWCDAGGPQLPGYVAGGMITFKVWRAFDNTEYNAGYEFAANGGSGVWGEAITVLSTITPLLPGTQSVSIDPAMVNMISFNINQEYPSTEGVFGGLDNLVVQDDNGDFYSPAYGIDEIGLIDYSEGYRAFVYGEQAASITMTGEPFNLSEVGLTLDPYKMNIMSYLPQVCMPVDHVFSGHEEGILIVKDDSGHFYSPVFGVMSLTEMCPGEGYYMFLLGSDAVDFFYPWPADNSLAKTSEAQKWEAYNQSSISQRYDVHETGISHPIIITELAGAVEVGDELLAYANDELVGAVRISDLDMPVALSAWGSYHGYGIDLPGYGTGDAIELRLWSEAVGKELYIEADLDSDTYGQTPLTSGTVLVRSDDALPTVFALSQNYPNPFNPTTTISFSMAEESVVSLNIYDISGRLINTLVNNNLPQGYHSVVWNGADSDNVQVSAGVYFYTLDNGAEVITNKMVLMK